MFEQMIMVPEDNIKKLMKQMSEEDSNIELNFCKYCIHCDPYCIRCLEQKELNQFEFDMKHLFC